MQGVHPDMVRVMRRALELSHIDFTILEGLRTLERQHELFAQGASTTMNSRHLTGHAVDVAPIIDGAITWHWPHYHELAAIVKQAAIDCGVKLEWGGDWQSFQDGPHWQLPWADYPVADYDASKAIGSTAAIIDPDGMHVDSDAVVEEDRDRTGVAAAGATAAGAGVATSAGLDLVENEGAAAAEASGEAAAGTAGESGADAALDRDASAEADSADAPSDTAPTADEPAGDEPAADAPTTEDAPADEAEAPPADNADADPEGEGADGAPTEDAGAPADEPDADLAPAEAEPADTEPADTEAADTEPTDTEPADVAPSDPGEAEPTLADAADDLVDGAEATGDLLSGDADAIADSANWFTRFIESENTLEIIALVLGTIVVILGLYLLIRRIIRWSRKRRAARRARRADRVSQVLKDV